MKSAAAHSRRTGWATYRLKDLARLNIEALAEDTPADRAFRYVDISGVDGLGRIVGWDDTAFGKAPSRARRLASPRDIVLSTVRTYLRAIAMVPEEAANLVFSTGFAVLHPKSALVHPEFLWRALQAEPGVQWIVAHSEGIGYPSISPGELGQLKISVPPVAQQRAIAVFLDGETARVDVLIAKKERLLALLNEQRTALITRAVTKGLDPAVPMKASGVEWLGEMPAHWQVKRLRFVCSRVRDSIQIGPFGSMLKELSYTGGPYKVYGQENVIGGDFVAGDRWITSPQWADLSRYEARPGDLLFTRKGSLGNCRLFPSDATRGIIDSDTIRVRLDGKLLDAPFLVRVLQEATYANEQMTSGRRGAVLGGLNSESIADLIIAVPPLGEQQRIASWLDHQTTRIDTLTHKIHNAIVLLREYRTALISAAVTGQIEVSTTDSGRRRTVDRNATD